MAQVKDLVTEIQEKYDRTLIEATIIVDIILNGCETNECIILDENTKDIIDEYQLKVR